MRTSPSRGLSLIEASLCLAALGVIVVVYFLIVVRQSHDVDAHEKEHLALRIQAAMKAYVAVNAHLPCPSPSADPIHGGKAICNGQTRGYLPYKDLGLPAPAAASVEYEVAKTELMVAGLVPAHYLTRRNTGLSTEFGAMPLQAAMSNTAPGVRLQDFCQALKPPTPKDQVAYTLRESSANAGPGSGSPSSGAPPSSAPGHTDPLEVPRSALWSTLNCSHQRAHALRANANITNSQGYLHEAFDNYWTVLKIHEIMYAADVVGGVIWLAQDGVTAYRHMTEVTAALGSDECGVCGAAPGAATASAITLAPTDAVAIAASTANLARFVGNQIFYAVFLAEANAIRHELDTLKEGSEARLKRVISHGWGI